MNILFILYGDLTTNTANPISLFADQLTNFGHECVIAIPSSNDAMSMARRSSFSIIFFDEILRLQGKIFSGDQRADVIHLCTPRIIVGRFIQQYQAVYPTPMVIYLEDNEGWITRDYLAMNEDEIFSLSDSKLEELVPKALSHPFEYPYLISLADLAILIQDKLRFEIPAYMPFRVIPWGVNQDIFHPGVLPSEKWRKHFLIQRDTKIIVYHGGLNGFTRPAIMDLCKAIGIINQQGISCKLIRTGINPINFWDELDSNSSDYILEAGVIERSELPAMLALADLYVQPGRINPFEDLRLPSKLPEFLSMGKPIILPNVNIASLFEDGSDALLLKTGDPNEIAKSCINVCQNHDLAQQLGINARIFAQKHFNLEEQTLKLVSAYRDAMVVFDAEVTQAVWKRVNDVGFAGGALLKAELLLTQSPLKCADMFNQVAIWEKNSNRRINALSSRIEYLDRECNLSKINPHQSQGGWLRKILRNIASYFK